MCETQATHEKIKMKLNSKAEAAEMQEDRTKKGTATQDSKLNGWNIQTH